MSFRDLLVVADATPASAGRIELAATLAAAHEAHLVGLYILRIPEAGRYARVTLVDQIVEEFIRDERKSAEAAEATFEATVARLGIKGEWRVGGGFAGEEAAIHARYVDLAIIGQVDPRLPGSVMPPLHPEEVALTAGRPVLVTPYVGQHTRLGRRILVGWNASREATRAVNDALPLLQGAHSVTILVANPAQRTMGPHGAEPGADIALHLARHGVRADVQRIVSKEVGAGDLLLSAAADLGADLIVAGAYGRSRARELILGGVTRDLLQQMTVPVFMSH